METKRFRPVGGDHELDADVRFVVACQPGMEERTTGPSDRSR
jgi:hypothetical protein